MPQFAYPQFSVQQQPRSMADVWNEPASPEAHLAHDQVTSNPRPAPLHEGVGWLLLKHLVQAALVGSVLLFVVEGGNSPAMTLSYVASAFVFLALVTVADRQRFIDHYPVFDIVEVVPPVEVPRRVEPKDRLALLIEQMHATLDSPVDVT